MRPRRYSLPAGFASRYRAARIRRPLRPGADIRRPCREATVKHPHPPVTVVSEQPPQPCRDRRVRVVVGHGVLASMQASRSASSARPISGPPGSLPACAPIVDKLSIAVDNTAGAVRVPRIACGQTPGPPPLARSFVQLAAVTGRTGPPVSPVAASATARAGRLASAIRASRPARILAARSSSPRSPPCRTPLR